MTDKSQLRESTSEDCVQRHENHGRLEGRTCLEKLLALLLCMCLVSVVVLSAMLVHSCQSQEQDVCMTKECTEIAARVSSAIDYSVDPCEDFYEFSCGTWIKKHVIPDDLPSLYTYTVLRDNVQITLKYLLEGTHGDDIEAVRKARQIYRSCMNRTQIELVNTTDLTDMLDELGGWPVLGSNPGGRWNESAFSLEEDLNRIRYLGASPFIRIYVDRDKKDAKKRLLILDEYYYSFKGKAYYASKQHASVRDAMKTRMINTAILLGADENTARQDMTDVFNLDAHLANISMSKAESRSKGQTYHKMTLSEVKVQYPSPDSGHAKLNWTSFIQGAVDVAGENISITDDEPVVIQSPMYYMKIFDLLKNTSARTIKNYMMWTMVAQMSTALPKRLEDEYYRYVKVYLGQSEPVRWKTCSKATIDSFGMAIGRVFVNETFDEEAKDKALEMIKEIREAFYERLDELDWMDDETKSRAIEKAKSITELIGYPDYILDDNELNEFYADFEVEEGRYLKNFIRILRIYGKRSMEHLRKPYEKDAEKWDKPPSTVNAFYHALSNTISFPAGILQPPYYSKYQPRSMNFGSIGFLIGHEITHAFDDQGGKYDKDGKLSQWWSAEAVARFKNKTQCIIDQYSQYKTPLLDLNVDGLFTQGENIADNGAILQSFRAYQRWTERNQVTEPLLPGLPYNHEQLFFISLAQGWCGLNTEQAEKYHVLSSPHSPGRFRVIGSMQNSEDFSRVFNCPIGSYMNPETKCQVW